MGPALNVSLHQQFTDKSCYTLHTFRRQNVIVAGVTSCGGCQGPRREGCAFEACFEEQGSSQGGGLQVPTCFG
jgi:hypothetical protein